MFRRKTAPEPERSPHPDPRVEAQLQHVLALYASAHRTEERLADIAAEQKLLDQKARAYADEPGTSKRLAEQSGRLRAERAELEAFIGQVHEDITSRLVSLGNDALYLHAAS
jgi:hypothetical protein